MDRAPDSLRPRCWWGIFSWSVFPCCFQLWTQVSDSFSPGSVLQNFTFCLNLPLFSPHHTWVCPFHSKSSLLGFYYCCTTLFLHLMSAVRICISREGLGEVSTVWGKSRSQVRVYAPSRHLLPLIPVMGWLHPVQEWSLQQRDSLKSGIACMTEF